MSLLFFGPPGCGKTTAGRLINPDNTYEINCAEQSSIDMVRTLRRTCSSVSFDGSRRIVLLDEADGLSKDAQAALRGVVEAMSSNNDFVMTANNPEKLLPAIKSRFMPIDFEPVRDPALLSQVEIRLSEIAGQEGHRQLPRGYVKSIVRNHFPDIRLMLKCLQFDLGSAH